MKTDDAALDAVRDLLRRWDNTTNPILLLAAGQLRAALRQDGHYAAAEAAPLDKRSR